MTLSLYPLTNTTFSEGIVLLTSETTGYAGGGIPKKSFSFKHRAKRVGSNNLANLYIYSIKTANARLWAAEHLMQVKNNSVHL